MGGITSTWPRPSRRASPTHRGKPRGPHQRRRAKLPGMDIKVEFDAEEWERQAKRAVHASASEAMEEIAADLQAVMDDVERTHSGKDPAEVESELRRRLAGTDFNLSDEHIKEYAAAIASGRHVQVEFNKSSLDDLLT